MTLRLRLLQTTDVHSNLLAYDYYTNREVPDYGLARAATLLRGLRSETPNALLFDNGDFLQGTPLSDLITLNDLEKGETHPAILAMNALGYDAATLGNHEFNFGLDWLKTALAAADFPVICANLLASDRGKGAEPLFPPYLLLDRQFEDMQGRPHSLRIGVIGFTPPQTTTWDGHHLKGRVESRDIPQTARQQVPRMRAAGADLVIALAHSGIASASPEPMKENAALELGAVQGVDAILAGHTHEVFPSARFDSIEGVCAANGRLNGTPAVMAGARASHIGLLDLVLHQTPRGWRVASAAPRARAVDPAAPPDSALTRLLEPSHARTLRRASQRLGATRVPLHSYLALAAPCAALRLVNRAKARAVRHLLDGTGEDGHPVLAASAPFKTGGRGGPGYFTDIPPGDLYLRHAADLYIFPNLLCAICLTGAELRNWLERAAVVFNQITPGQPDQHLLDARLPGHHFDVIEGLDYEIDVSQPPRFDATGRFINPAARRIRNLRFEGQPIDDERTFILATNNYRAHGGGPYPATRPEQVVPLGNRLIRDVLAAHISEIETVTDQGRGRRSGWAFRKLPDTTVILETGPGLRRYRDEMKATGLQDRGESAQGFLRLALDLG